MNGNSIFKVRDDLRRKWAPDILNSQGGHPIVIRLPSPSKKLEISVPGEHRAKVCKMTKTFECLLFNQLNNYIVCVVCRSYMRLHLHLEASKLASPFTRFCHVHE